jgi:predicted SAM-dependent methyltransferase
MGPIKLNIGERKRAEGWTTVDIDPGPEVDYTCDCGDLAAFKDNSVATIYASHVLEHVSYVDDISATLKEWFRVLVPGGELMVSVPDFHTLCRLFLHHELTSEERFHVMRIIFGGQMAPYDFHSVGLTLEFLGSYLNDAGFVNIERVEGFGLFQDSSVTKFGNIAISLNVTARKPG